MKYRCALCRCLYDRDNTKAWIKSYCGKKGKMTRLMKCREKEKTND